MKLNNTRPNIESSGFVAEQFFSIKDQGMIFDILRSKMYSNPILAICREISCNARDAHREVGKPEVPVVIVLPNQLDYNYRVKDSGPGISPDRMSNIFIQYTASTKRDDNLQTGGFGLGCKTPFSYSDTFNVITVHNGTKYQYTCFIDETKVGKLILHSEEPTEEVNGTEIVIPVEPKDVHLFVEWTAHACRHWVVKPTVRGGSIRWNTPEVILKGDDWSIITDPQHDANRIKAIIDGIEYPLSMDALRTYTDRIGMIESMSGDLLLYFGVGELSLSASREQVYLDEKTQKKINDRLQSIFSIIKKMANDNIDQLPTLWEANIYYRKQLSSVFQDLRFLGKLEWRGCELHGQSISLGCPIFTFSKGKYVRKGGFDPDQITRGRLSSLHFDLGHPLYINDLPIKDPTPKHVKKAFETDPALKQIQVVSPTDKITEEYLNKYFNLDKMAPKRLSSIVKVSKRNHTAPSSRLLVFKFDQVSNTYRQVSYASIDEDTNDKVICLLRKEVYPANTRLPLCQKHVFNLKSVATMVQRDPKISFYGVDQDTPQKRLDEEFDDFEQFEMYIDRKILNSKLINYVEIKLALNHQYQADDRLTKNVKTLEGLVLDKNSPFIKRVRLHQKIKEINAGDTSLLPIYEAVKGEIKPAHIKKFVDDNPDYDLDALDAACEKKYPLLNGMSLYNINNVIQHVAHYINLIDTHG